MVKSEKKEKIWVNISFFQRDAKKRTELLDKVRKEEIELAVQFLDGSEPVKITKLD